MRVLQRVAALAVLVFATLPAAARAGDGRLFCRWESDGYFYPAKIEKENDGKFFVRYTDDVTEWVPGWRLLKIDVKEGSLVYGNWKNRGLYYGGKVTSRDGDNIHIAYDDGDEEDTTIDLIRVKQACSATEVGCAVMGRWAADGYYYPGTVKEIKNGKLRILFDDGDKAWLDAKDVFIYTPTYADRIEGNWLGKGKFYTGKIIKRNGRNVRIEYDDGDVEDTTISYLRADYSDNTIRVAK